MSVIKAVKLAVATSPIMNLQRASDPKGVRLFLQSPTDIDCADSNALHDSIIEDASRRGIARDLVLGLVEHACNAARRGPQDKLSIYFIRAPIAMIADELFQADLERRVADGHMDRARICLEIPETPFREPFASIGGGLWRLKDRGFPMSLANFGTGMSSLASLRSFPLAFVQIAPSLVSGLLTDPLSREMVRRSNEIAHMISGIRTIGAGADSEDDLMVLQSLGVDYVEGPGIARPRLDA